MSPAAVQQQIASGNVGPVYLLVGDDDRLIAAVSGALAGTIEEDLRVFNHERLYATDKDMTPELLVEAARIAPMMSVRRIVVLLRAEAWLRPKRPAAVDMQDEDVQDEAGASDVPDKSALAPLVDYLKAPVSTTTMVIIASEVNKALGAVKALHKSAAVVECRGLADSEAPRGGDTIRQALAVVRETADASGRQIETPAAQLLAERSGGDIGKLRADLDHVLLFTQGSRAITRGDVQAVVSDRETVQDQWAIVNALERQNARQALRLLAAMLDDGEPPLKVLGQLAWFARDRLSRARPGMVSAAIEAVFRTDQDMKSSGGDPRILLERLVVELCR